MTNNFRHLKQGDHVSSEYLKSEWNKTVAFYDEMIDAGHPLRPIRFLVRHIIDKDYHAYLFPGTSLFDLLVSLPLDQKINYSKTLRVEIDSLRSIILFRYWDNTAIQNDPNTARVELLKWPETCQLMEICDTFEHFINRTEDWNAVLK